MKKTTKSAPVRINGRSATDEHQWRLDQLQTTAAAQFEHMNLNMEERAFLGTCQQIYRNDIGCYTPFESFFVDLVRWTMWGNTPTLESLREVLKDADSDFVNNWTPMMRGLKRFVKNYPDLVAELQEAEKRRRPTWEQEAASA